MILLLQYLRAVAALMVVLHHAQASLPMMPVVVPYFFANAGVYLFFAISGFLMVHITEEREQAPRSFLIARAVRIVPIYWIATAAVAAMLIALPALSRTNELSLRHFLLSLLFVPHETAHSNLPMLGVGWSLNYEMFFYALFACAMAVSLRHRATLTIGILVALTVMALVTDVDLIRYYGDPVVLQFVFGMIIALVVRKLPTASVPVWAFLAALVGALGWMMLADGLIDRSEGMQRILAYGVPTALVLAVALLAERNATFKSPTLLLLGNASYSIYLFHMFPMPVVRAAWMKLAPQSTSIGGALLAVLLVSLIGAIFGVACYLLIERSIQRFFRHKTRPAKRPNGEMARVA